MKHAISYRFLWIICLLVQADIGKAQDAIADHMLLYQRSVGGWPKHIGEEKIDYTKAVSPAQIAGLADDYYRNDATIDNNATTKEIRYLVKAYRQTGNKKYLGAAEKGIQYLLTMQNRSGGWPQFYPDSSLYRSEITFNDNAMINAMNVLWDVAHRTGGMEVVNSSFIQPAQAAIDKGIACILATQIKVNGKLTAWCAQYNAATLQPAKARSFELVSISGSESVGIVAFLMKIPHPSPSVKLAIDSAVQWFKSSQIKGYRYVDITDATQPNGRDRVLQPDSTSVVWARFYDIDTNRPFFSGRDSHKKWSVTEIENERRTGYGWYGTWPKQLIEKEYPEWKQKQAQTL